MFQALKPNLKNQPKPNEYSGVADEFNETL